MAQKTTMPAVQQPFDVGGLTNIVQQAPKVLTQNQQSAQKAGEAAQTLIDNANEAGMSDALDGQMAAFVSKAKATLSTMNERRKPFTQIVDAAKKHFTLLESDIKTSIDNIQKVRDAYASKKMEEQRERERQEQLRLDKEREAIQLKQQAETYLANSFAEHLAEAKQAMLDAFNDIKLSNIEIFKQDIQSWSETLPKDTYKIFAPNLTGRLHNTDETNVFISAALNKFYPIHIQQYQTEIAALKCELIDKLPSKQRELEELAKADEVKKAQLEEERKKREAADKARIEAEAQAAKEKAAADAAVQAAAATASATVDAQAALSFESKPEVKEGYEIIIKNVAANLLIAQFWFENEGKELSQEKINRVSFERMRKFCEAHALKTGEVIESPLIEYKPIYKAK